MGVSETGERREIMNDLIIACPYKNILFSEQGATTRSLVMALPFGGLFEVSFYINSFDFSFIFS